MFNYGSEIQMQILFLETIESNFSTQEIHSAEEMFIY